MASLKSGIIIGVAAAGVAAAALAGGGVRWSPSATGADRLATTPISTATIFSPPPGAPLSFADIFEKVAPAVVSIEVTTHLTARELQSIPGFQIPNIGPKGGDGDNGDGDGDDGDSLDHVDPFHVQRSPNAPSMPEPPNRSTVPVPES